MSERSDPTNTTTRTRTPASTPGGPVLAAVRALAIVTALCALAQAGLGMGVLGGDDNLLGWHQPLGYATVVLAIAMGVASVVWRGRSGNVGLMMHALTVAVLALAQVGLGEAGLQTIHVTVGILFLVAALALVPLTLRNGGLGRVNRA